MLKGKKIGFIGGGFMAEALLHGLLKSGGSSKGDISVSDIRPERLEYLRSKYGVNADRDNKKVAASDVVVLAVKPQEVDNVMGEIGPHLHRNGILISIAAGVKTAKLAGHFGGKIVRVMPNTCAQAGEGVTAISFAGKGDGEERGVASALFGSVGKTIFVGEELMDAVTGISGSGPAYIYLVMESLIEAGIGSGLSKDDARMLVYQTVKGAAVTAMETGEEPSVLRERITSPKGTTAAALKVLEDRGVRVAFKEAVEAAVARSKELG